MKTPINLLETGINGNLVVRSNVLLTWRERARRRSQLLCGKNPNRIGNTWHGDVVQPQLFVYDKRAP
jgi:hypothetical protein